MTTTRFAPHGMVCTVDHLASEAGVAILRAGGSAVDAAIAANAVLAVTAPHMCGLGGDLFALVHSGAGTGPVALNASGRAGSGADPGPLRAAGLTRMPPQGDIRAVPVPGCVDGWLALHDRFGRLDLGRVLTAAIGYAEDGFPASPLLAWTASLVSSDPGAADLAAATEPGAPVRRPGVARALRAIAGSGRDGFYRGEFGAGLIRLGAGAGGAAHPDLFTEADLARPLADWVDPLGVTVFDHQVWTCPPNSQGYLLLLGLAIAEGLDLPGDPGDPLWPHLLVESARLAGYDRPAVLHEHADVAGLITGDGPAARRARIDPDRRAAVADHAEAGDTTYLCAVDSDGMGVSLIQSNAGGYGCRLFEPGTGIGLQNRGIGFSLEPGHPAEYGPGRRPPHTLLPALVTRPDGGLRAVCGSMGGDSQPQVMLQVLTRFLRHGEPPGEAISAPRWRLGPPPGEAPGTGFDTWDDPDRSPVEVEQAAPQDWVVGLAARGHRVVSSPAGFGHAQMIEVRPDGVRAGAADHRALIEAATGY